MIARLRRWFWRASLRRELASVRRERRALQRQAGIR